MVTCAICGAEGRVLTKHLRKVHGLTRKDYEYLYPGHPVVCEETNIRGKQIALFMHTSKAKKSASNGRSNYWSTLSKSDIAERVSAMVSYKKSDNGRKEQSERMKILSPEYWKSQEYRDKVSKGISDSMKEHWSDESYRDKMIKIFRETPHELSDDVVEIRRQNMERLNERIYSDPEYRKSVCSPLLGKGENAGSRGGIRVHYISKSNGEVVFRSLWELKVAIALDDLSIKWEYEPCRLTSETLNYIPDFIVNDIILEVKPSDFIDSLSEAKKSLSLSKGYKFLYITEIEVPDILNTELEFDGDKVLYTYAVQRLSKYDSLRELLSRVGVK